MLTREFVENLAVTSSLDTAKRERERTGGASANQRPERPKVPRLDAETDGKREMSGCEQRRMKIQISKLSINLFS